MWVTQLKLTGAMLIPIFRVHEFFLVFFAVTLVLPRSSPFHIYQLPATLWKVIWFIPGESFGIYKLATEFYKRSRLPAAERQPIELSEIKTRNILLTERPLVSSNANMERVLRIEHLLLPIAADLHYTDLVNLSHTSRCIREAVFPHMDMIYRKRKLYNESCESIKHNCWNCNRQTCGVSMKSSSSLNKANQNTGLSNLRTSSRRRRIRPFVPMQATMHNVLLQKHLSFVLQVSFPMSVQQSVCSTTSNSL